MNMDLGKMAPSAVDLEEAVLGGMMLDREGLEAAMEIIKPVMFYREEHIEICKAIFSLKSKNEPVDILTVVYELKLLGSLDRAIGAHYISSLTNRIASTANIQVHARIILEKYYQREVIRISTETLQKAYQDTTDVFELLSTAEANIASVDNSNTKNSETFAESLEASEIALKERGEAYKRGEVMGVNTGFAELTYKTGGWQNGDLVIIAARPGMGKSALGINFAKAAARHNMPSALFLLEMVNVKASDRIILGETGIDYHSYRSGNLNPYQWENFKQKKQELSKLKIFLDDTSALSMRDFRIRARRLVSRHGVKLIIFDYLQLATTGVESNQNREQEVSYISRTLKATAKELNVPILALCQLSRETTKRASKRPILSDLRESGAIEQDADIVMFPYNPHKEGLTGENGESLQGQIELIIEKHRDGPCGSVFVGCNESMTMFHDLQSNQ